MYSYQYKHGDRPLDGYTIQRAAGRGGFGEVYFATSDSGREVALKVITAYEQIELRGISQCMNLKSPHLVTIFDVRHNDQGRPFVIMEYVAGANLRDLLDQSPAGLGPQKAAFFLREIAKGLSFLHECGIVHRDLKPGNIFFENGYVKIGDYGLSKAIAPTHHSGQTVTVGTVHYMAPEVGHGRYDRSIDIYALGALLYEMLTGTVPFVGASPSEILFKHLSHEPDCSGIDEPFASAIKKAMAKDPQQRFASVQEMVEAVFGAEHVRNSVSQFAPQELSMVAGRIAERIAVPVGAGLGSGGGGPPPAGRSSVTSPVGLGMPKGNAPEAGDRFGREFFDAAPSHRPAYVPPHPAQRHTLALLASVAIGMCAAALSGAPAQGGFAVFLAVYAGAWGVLVGINWVLPRLGPMDEKLCRLVVAASGAGLAFLASSPFWARGHPEGNPIGSLLPAVIALFLVDVRKSARPERHQRFELGPAVGGGFIGFIAGGIFNASHPALMAAVAGGVVLVTQALAPWSAGVKAEDDTDDDDDDDFKLVVDVSLSPPSAWNVERRVPHWLTVVWACGVPAFIALGVTFNVLGANSQDPVFEGIAHAIGVSCYLAGGFCFLRMWHRRIRSWRSYLIVPVLRLASLILSVTSAILFGMVAQTPQAQGLLIFFVIFGGVMWLMSWMIPSPEPQTQAERPAFPSVVPPVPPSGADAIHAARQAAAGAAETARETAHGAAKAARQRVEQVRRRLRARRPFDWLGGLASVLALAFLLAAFAAALSLALDLPGAVAAGLPDPTFRDQLQRDTGTTEWPSLVRSVLTGIGAVLLAAGLVCLIVARRQGGAVHILRGLVGVAFILASLWPLHVVFGGTDVWLHVADRISSAAPATAIAIAREHISTRVWIAAVLVLLIGTMLLALPSRRFSERGAPR